MDSHEKLQNLHDELISEGCNNFHVCGIINKGHPFDDVVCLDNVNNKWEIYYIERGVKGKIYYSTSDLDNAINYYKDYIKSMTHWHLICFTRSNEIMQNYKRIIETNGIEITQNDIPAYKNDKDYVFRIFVKNKDIFKVKLLFEKIPYYDSD